ncbi:hypothetical protein L2E82_38926 [Cichorium intybus]|uniref:Uncharacterized protein n=1 Tax=Cichorium intybus TaxID=13427 RepID=A0ACB9AH27_CICIN|nr:hypothetical protein L2E82_38926 [Cichorium intybus]
MIMVYSQKHQSQLKSVSLLLRSYPLYHLLLLHPQITKISHEIHFRFFPLSSINPLPTLQYPLITKSSVNRLSISFGCV